MMTQEIGKYCLDDQLVGPSFDRDADQTANVPAERTSL